MKFQIKVGIEELADKTEAQVKKELYKRVQELYRQKEIEFPVTIAMAQFMSDKQQQQASGGQRYDREGLYQWAVKRFPQASEQIKEDDFRTLPRTKLQELVRNVSQGIYPKLGHDAIDAAS